MKQNKTGIRAIVALVLVFSFMFSLIVVSRGAEDDAPLMYVNNAPWYKESSLTYVKIYNDYFVPMSIFAMLDNVEIVENARLGTTMIRYGNNKYFSFDTETGEFAYTEESGQFYLKTYLLYTDRYVPAKRICDYFGFRYETYEHAGKLALRISNADNTRTIEDILRTYNPSLLKREETTVAITTPAVTDPPTPVIGERTIYLTFEDTPNENTEAILDLLKKYGMKATFFVTTEGIKEYPELIRRMYAEGHAVGLHPIISEAIMPNASTITDELKEANRLLFRLVKRRTRLVRLPEGTAEAVDIFGEGLLTAIDDAGYALWDWNVDTKDTAKTTAKRIFYRASDGIVGYDTPILRFHSGELTVPAIEELLEYINDNEKFTCATLSPSMEVRIINYR